MCPAAALALLLCLVVGSRQLTITEFEVPTTLQSGENAELRCRSDLAGKSEDSLMVKWWWKPVDDTRGTSQLYQRIADEKGASLRHNIEMKDNDTIVLLDSTPADSGVYECEVSSLSKGNEEVRKHQELTIFTQGSGPNLTISIVPDGPDYDDEEEVLIECRAEEVAPVPDIGLTIDGNDINMTEYIVGPNEQGLYDIVGNATLNKTDVEGLEVHCELFYLDLRISHPPYVATQLYNPSGAWNNTEAPQNATEPDVTPDSLQTPSGDSVQCRVSWTLLVAFGLLTQVPALL